jgi:hypothetical protein
MAIDKALYQLPQGIEALAEQESPLEIEIENPDSVTIGMDGLEIEIEPESEASDDFYANLAEEMDDRELQSIASDLTSDFEGDIAARKDWIQTYVDGLELLGLKIEERSEPWEGACGVYHPMLSEALVKFQSETMMSIFPAMGPVKTKVIGKETPATKAAAERVQEDMNYQLTEVMQEYRPETERLLWGLGLAGNAFKKVYEDEQLGRQVAMYVPAEDMVVPYGASSLESAERVTHVMRKTENEMRSLQVSGFYRDIDLGEPANILDEVEKKIAEKLGFRATTDDRYKVLEMHVNLDLDGYEHTDEDGDPTGVALPYIVAIEKGTNTILSIRRNWEPDDEKYKKRQSFVHYGYIPGFGFYCFGLIHLIGAYAKSGTSIIRQLVDAGSLANLPGGFKTRGLRIKGDDTPIAPGEFRDVDVPSGAMRDNIMPLPYKEPSQVLMALLGQIVDEGRRFANTADLNLSDMSANAPVGTTLAILERTLKVMSAVQARVHFSLKQELKLLKRIIADNTPEEYHYEPVIGSRMAKRSDYESTDVIPVSDPNASTMAQKIVQYQAAMQLAQQSPNLFNMPLMYREMLDVLGIKNAQKLVPLPEDMKPKDPVTENQDILSTKPVKAFQSQDHKAHIAVHTAAMKDPKIMELVGQSPLAQQIGGAMQAHIAEHLGFEYRVQIEQQLGMTLPPTQDESGEDVNMDPEVEARLAPMLAQAAQRLLQQNQAEAAQQQAQKQQQDPIVQMQMQELQIKQADQQRKAQKDAADIQFKQQQLQVDSQLKKKQIDIDALKAATQSKEQKANRDMAALKVVAEMNHNKDEADRTRAMNAVTRATEMMHEKSITDKRHDIDLTKHFNQQKKEPKQKGE